MNSASVVLIIVGGVFGVLAGVGARYRREGVYITGFLGIVAVVMLEGVLRLLQRGYSVSWLGVWLGALTVLIIYVAYLFTAMRRGLGFSELERCFALSRRAYLATAVVLPLALSMIIGGALAPVIALQHRSELTSSKLYGIAIISTTLVILGVYATYYVLSAARRLCPRK